jgi:nucleoid-associated protein YgaU
VRDFRPPLALAFVASFLFAGCASLPSDASAPGQRSSAAVVKNGDSAITDSEKTTETANDKTNNVATAADSEPAPSPVVHDPNATPTARLVEQLNDATRELAMLRASNAKLKASAAKPPAPVVVREPDPADVKLAASFHSYAQFKQELTGFFADLEKLRTENTALSAGLTEAAASSKEAKAALAKLERELQSEKDAHAQAEQTVTKLREQLRAVADAVAAAGLSFDKAPSGAEPTARLETSRARLRAAATTRQHVVKDGDTLETLADHYYGDATKWKLILDANRGRLPLDGAMPTGLELDIPAK